MTVSTTGIVVVLLIIKILYTVIVTYVPLCPLILFQLHRLYILGKCTKGSLRESSAKEVRKQGRKIKLKSRKVTRSGFRVENAIYNFVQGKLSESKIIIIYIIIKYYNIFVSTYIALLP